MKKELKSIYEGVMTGKLKPIWSHWIILILCVSVALSVIIGAINSHLNPEHFAYAVEQEILFFWEWNSIDWAVHSYITIPSIILIAYCVFKMQKEKRTRN